jgi:hypothetical protein
LEAQLISTLVHAIVGVRLVGWFAGARIPKVAWTIEY